MNSMKNNEGGSTGTPETKGRPDYRGHVDILTDKKLKGWAYQEGNVVPRISVFINVAHYADFDCITDRIDAAQYTKRPAKGFDISLNASLKEGDTIWIYHSGTRVLLNGNSSYHKPVTAVASGNNLLGAGGGGNNSGMEARIAKLESDVSHIKENLSEMKQDTRDLRSDLKTDFRLAFGALITTALGLACLMAKGFHWI